jgi:hypothetical protein
MLGKVRNMPKRNLRPNTYEPHNSQLGIRGHIQNRAFATSSASSTIHNLQKRQSFPSHRLALLYLHHDDTLSYNLSLPDAIA